MTDSDFDQIESELGIRLPAVYRKLMNPFPIPAYGGNGDREGLPLWDSASDLIELTREMRSEFTSESPWPDYLFALGMEGSGEVHAIDTRQSIPEVISSMQGQLQAESPHVQFAEWSDDVLESIRVDLEKRGIDQAITSQQREAIEDAEASRNTRVFTLRCAGLTLVFLLIRGCAEFF